MTHFDPHRHHRRSIRLKEYNYAQEGAYFVTICTQHRQLFFDDPEICQWAQACWLAIPDYTPGVELDEWVVMPNHLHGIIILTGENVPSGPGRGVHLNAPPDNRLDTAGGVSVQSYPPATGVPYPSVMASLSPRAGTLGVIIRNYKAAMTIRCRRLGRYDFAWQRNYYEHVIRNERELDAIRVYIRNNPLKWAMDRDHPGNIQRHGVSDKAEVYWHDAGLG